MADPQPSELGQELEVAHAALEDAPGWLQQLPIENSDRVMARRISEAAALGSDHHAVFVDATGHDHSVRDAGQTID